MENSITAQKQALRTELLARLSTLAPQEKAHKDIKISKLLSYHWENYFSHEFQAVFTFFPLPTEVNFTPFLQSLLSMHVPVYLPRIEGGNLVYATVKDLQNLRPHPRGMLEPDKKAETFAWSSPCSVLVLVPLLGFDAQYRRLGSGKGYYDRFFHQKKDYQRLFSLGITYEQQEVLQIPSEAHDFPLHGMITEGLWE